MRRRNPRRVLPWPGWWRISEREGVFAETDLLAASLAWKPGSVTIGEATASVARLENDGTLHA